MVLSLQVEADSLRLQIAAHPNPELRAKLEEAGVQVRHDDAQGRRHVFCRILLPVRMRWMEHGLR